MRHSMMARPERPGKVPKMGPETVDITQYDVEAPLPGLTESVREARAIVSEALRSWSLARLEDDAVLAVSELATNAVAASPERDFVLLVRLEPLTDTVYVGVRDRSGVIPTAPRAHLLQESGRGLLIVASVSHEYGIVMHPIGKTVWARFKVDKKVD